MVRPAAFLSPLRALNPCLTHAAAGGKSAQATILDACEACGYGGIDMSPSLFSHFANRDTGIIYVECGFPVTVVRASATLTLEPQVVDRKSGRLDSSSHVSINIG